MKVGDYIQISDTAGSVEEINILFTQLLSPGNQVLIVPNSKFMSDIITNFSRKNYRRNDLVVGVGYSDSLDKVKIVLQELVGADKRILHTPAEPLIVVTDLADSCVNLMVRYWTTRGDYLMVRSELTEAVKLRFDKEGFNIPYPQLDVHVNQVVG